MAEFLNNLFIEFYLNEYNYLSMDKTQFPKRHHYIPRFILRNFCFKDEITNYWNKEKQLLSPRNIKNIFMNENMYKVDAATPDDEYKIETNLGIFECEIAQLIREKFLAASTDIVITRADNEKLRIFFELMSFRANHRLEQYKNSKFDPSTKFILDCVNDKENYVDLWKKELEELAGCRTLEEIKNLKNVDPIIQQDFLNEISCYYMTVVDSRGQDFIMSDILPTLEIFPLPDGVNLHLHQFFPISPKRMIVLNHVIFKKDRSFIYQNIPFTKQIIEYSMIKGNALTQPFDLRKNKIQFNPDDQYRYHIQKIYENDVTYINALILNESRIGFIFKDLESVKNSIYKYQKRKDIKQDYSKLINYLDKIS